MIIIKNSIKLQPVTINNYSSCFPLIEGLTNCLFPVMFFTMAFYFWPSKDGISRYLNLVLSHFPFADLSSPFK